MLIISLAVYIVIYPVFKYFLFPLLSIKGFLLDISFVLIYAIAFGIIWTFYNVAKLTNKTAKNVIDVTISAKGVKSLTAAIFLVSFGSLVMIILWARNLPNSLQIDILVPIALVSGIETMRALLGYDSEPQWLMPDKPKKTDIPTPDINPRVMPATPDFVPEEDVPIIEKKYIWDFESQTYQFQQVILKDSYESCKNRLRNIDYQNWADEYVVKGMTSEVREAAKNLYRLSKSYGTWSEVHFVIEFVHQILRYEYDIDTTGQQEYPRYPLESMVDQVGDCEDYSILGAAILKYMGYDVALLSMPGHEAMGIAGVDGMPGAYIEHKGTKYYFCEMTAKGWEIGQIGEGHNYDRIEVFPIPGPGAKVARKED